MELPVKNSNLNEIESDTTFQLFEVEELEERLETAWNESCKNKTEE